MQKLKPIQEYTDAVRKDVYNLQVKLRDRYGITHKDVHKNNVMQTQDDKIRLILA
jgi:Ser/Thr protein kinase RdoA (MazF antagonist)